MSELTEKELKLKIKQRGTVRAKVTRELGKIKPVFDVTPPDSVRAEIVKDQLRDCQAKLKSFDEVILTNVSDADWDTELERSEYYETEIIAGLSSIQTQMKMAHEERTPASPSSPGLANKDLHPKLPKLEIPKYNGDPLTWDEFWDNFNSSIHDRADLPVIDKFKYLKSFLQGEALRLADGYRLTIANYEEVVNALKERFGDPELATFSHFEALIALKPASYNLSELRAILDKCESHIRSLVALGLPESTFGVVFTPLILSKLPKGVKIELHQKNGSEKWRLENLRLLLKEEISAREKGERIFASAAEEPAPRTDGTKPKPSFFPAGKRRPPSSAALTSPARADSKGSASFLKCVFCSGNYYSSACQVYKDVDSRLKQVRGKCHCCLRPGHRAPECRSKRSCYFCRRDTHHQSLCRDQSKRGAAERETSHSLVTATVDSPPEISNQASETNLSLQASNSKSILQTALGEIKGKRGKMKARLYFDTGGSRSFISENAAKRIGATSVGRETVSVGRFRDAKHSSVTYTVFEFDICLPNGNIKTVRMSGEKTISCPIQLIPLDCNCPILSQVKLAEPIVKSPEMVAIDILVGNDYYYEFIGEEQIRCSNGVVLLASPFGFIAGGSLSTSSVARKYESSFFIHAAKQPMQSVERMWILEDIGIKENYSQSDDEIAMKSFNDTVQFTENRYYVKWPWKEQFPKLPDNYALATGRLKSLSKRLQSDRNLLQAYDTNIQDQKNKGIIEPAPLVPDGVVHHLPHHCVITPAKTTTKLRVVYDASAKTSKEAHSLNECLYRGPVLLANSVGILLRWRMTQVAVVSDIEKAFLQVGLQLPDRDATRFLWLKDPNAPPTKANIETYCFCRIPFGVISSPFLLEATIAHHLKTVDTPVANAIHGNVYVDNVFGGANCDADVLQFYQESKKIFSAASMNLREWYSNSKSFMNQVPANDKGTGYTTSVLGLKWDAKEDDFSMSVGRLSKTNHTWTKRLVLQAIALVYDPLGLFNPVTILGKLLMQRLWKTNSGWDEEILPEIRECWISYLPELMEIPTVKIPRWIHPSFSRECVAQLHCFCDASAKAYATVIYFRLQPQEDAAVGLLFAKSRVAPIKPVSMPRLELLAVLIGIRCLKFLQEELPITVSERYVWSDSSSALHWIQKQPVTTVFVQNRVREIRSVPNVKFRYVPTSQNPADMPSRGVPTDELKNCPLWWNGPSWLARNSNRWPTPQFFLEGPKEEAAPTANVSTLVTPTDTSSKELLLDLTRYSSVKKMYRVTAYLFRFIGGAQKQIRHQEIILSAQELEFAKRFWDKAVQQNSFSAMYNTKTTVQFQKLRHQLGLFVDSEGLIRCKGRYLPSQSTPEILYPKLLPKNSPYTELIVRGIHEKLFHAGVKHTLAEVRQEYWIIHGRDQVKKTINKCSISRFYDGGSFKVPDPCSLPEYRITQERPFQIAGIDYMGPLLIKDRGSQETKKAWICLFTCATVRSIHLEALEDMTTEQFLLCFRRFVAAYGRPRLVISDNAKQYHMARRTFSHIWRQIIRSSDVQSLSANNEISWKFITELAPWMGGFYERMVGLVKTALKKAIHSKCLTFVELRTLLAEIKFVLNSRPLLYNEESAELDYLTPGHFLQQLGESFPTISTEEEYRPQSITSDALIRNWKRIQAMLDTLWKIWKSSYLQSLQQQIWKPNNRNASSFPPLKDTVVIVKDTTTRGTWKLGIITELIESHDHVCRSAFIRLPSGNIIRRPLKLLFPLESTENPVGVTLARSNISETVRGTSTRAAAAQARGRIKAITNESSSDEKD